MSGHYHAQARQATLRLLEGIEEGLYDRDVVIRSCLNYMSEADVSDMATSEGFWDEDEDAEELEDGDEDGDA